MTPRTLLAAAYMVLALGLHASAQDDCYVVEDIPVPDDILVEAGGLGFLGDRLVISTRRGQVWLVDGVIGGDVADARFKLFAEGLHEGLGLEVVDDVIHVMQRGEITRLIDTDGDDRADRFETLTDGWGLSGNYHEFGFGLPRDDEGNFYVSLNVAFWGATWWLGRSPAAYRGWVLQVSPDGAVTPFAPGFRSPCGIGRNLEGEIFVTDNQGDWMPACPLTHVQKGKFYGHPASLAWTEDYRREGKEPSDSEPPPVKRAAISAWLPYGWVRSAGNPVADGTDGLFGPFEGQLFIGDVTNSLIVRAPLERVRGEYQGAVIPFKRDVGAAARIAFAPDGTLIVGRTNRGWGGRAPGSGLARVRWTGAAPLDMKEVSIRDEGFRITLTEPIAEAPAPGSIVAHEYDYNYWWLYGSPEQRMRRLDVESATLSDDGLTLTLAMELRAGKVVRAKLPQLRSRSGAVLRNDEFAYTINQLPSGPLSPAHVAKTVPPPRPIEHWHENWLRLTIGDALDSWRGDGWEMVSDRPQAEVQERTGMKHGRLALDPSDPSKLEIRASDLEAEQGKEPMTEFRGAAGSELACRYDHGAVEAHVTFMVPEGARGEVLFQGRYAIRFGDVHGDEVTVEHCGAIAPGSGFAGQAPMFQTYRGAGQWHTLSVFFYPPVFDDAGRKLTDAYFARVRINDELLHEGVTLSGPSDGAVFEDEGRSGPIVLRATKGEVAFRQISMRALDRKADEPGWERIFDGIDLEGWKKAGAARWSIEDGVLVGEGPTGHLFSPRGDYTDHELRAQVKIGDDGNSGMYVRASYGEGWPAGYEAQVNATFKDPVKTGSLYGHDLIRTQLVPPNVWATQQVTVQNVEDGVRVTIRLNGFVVADFVDRDRKFSRGHVALQQHHEGSVVKYRDIEVRELR